MKRTAAAMASMDPSADDVRQRVARDEADVALAAEAARWEWPAGKSLTAHTWGDAEICDACSAGLSGWCEAAVGRGIVARHWECMMSLAMSQASPIYLPHAHFCVTALAHPETGADLADAIITGCQAGLLSLEFSGPDRPLLPPPRVAGQPRYLIPVYFRFMDDAPHSGYATFARWRGLTGQTAANIRAIFGLLNRHCAEVGAGITAGVVRAEARRDTTDGLIAEMAVAFSNEHAGGRSAFHKHKRAVMAAVLDAGALDFDTSYIAPARGILELLINHVVDGCAPGAAPGAAWERVCATVTPATLRAFAERFIMEEMDTNPLDGEMFRLDVAGQARSFQAFVHELAMLHSRGGQAWQQIAATGDFLYAICLTMRHGRDFDVECPTRQALVFWLMDAGVTMAPTTWCALFNGIFRITNIVHFVRRIAPPALLITPGHDAFSSALDADEYDDGELFTSRMRHAICLRANQAIFDMYAVGGTASECRGAEESARLSTVCSIPLLSPLINRSPALALVAHQKHGFVVCPSILAKALARAAYTAKFSLLSHRESSSNAHTIAGILELTKHVPAAPDAAPDAAPHPVSVAPRGSLCEAAARAAHGTYTENPAWKSAKRIPRVALAVTSFCGTCNRCCDVPDVNVQIVALANLDRIHQSTRLEEEE